MKISSLSLSTVNSNTNTNTMANKKAPSFGASLVCTPKAFKIVLTRLSEIHSLFSRIKPAEEVEQMFGKEPFSAVEKYREFRKNFEEQTREALPGYRFILTPSSRMDHALGLKLQTPDKKTFDFNNALIDPTAICSPRNKEGNLNSMAYEILLTGAELLRRSGKRLDESNTCVALIRKLANPN